MGVQYIPWVKNGSLWEGLISNESVGVYLVPFLEFWL